MTISGFDLIKMNDVSASVKIFSILALLFALAIVFIPKKSMIFFSSIGGLVSLLIAYIIVKGNMHSGNDFGMSDAIELKSGSYLSVIGFLVSAFLSKMKNELFQNQQVNPPVSDKDDATQ